MNRGRPVFGDDTPGTDVLVITLLLLLVYVFLNFGRYPGPIFAQWAIVHLCLLSQLGVLSYEFIYSTLFIFMGVLSVYDFGL